MKSLKYLFLALVLSFGVSALTSCNLWDDKEADLDPGDLIVDWSPVELYISIEDSYGNDLLDTLSNSCVADYISATFRGQTLEVRKNSDGYLGLNTLDTRAYMPVWHGLCLINKRMVWNGKQWNLEKTDKFMLYLGEIDGAKDMDEDLTLTITSGLFKDQKHVIHYHCSDHKVTKKEINCNRWYSLDGKTTESNTIKIVLQ